MTDFSEFWDEILGVSRTSNIWKTQDQVGGFECEGITSLKRPGFTGG